MDASMMMMAAAGCAAKCPTHAAIALAAVFGVGLIAGIAIGRRGRAKNGGACTCGKKAGRVNERRMPMERKVSEPRGPIPAGSVEIYVGNLSYDLTEDGLRKAFEVYGEVTNVRIVTNRYNNRSKGFGFVVMTNRAEAEKAIAEMDGKDFMGRTLRANEAKNTIKEESAAEAPAQEPAPESAATPEA